MNYEFKLDYFEGPLDLLLHLVKESKLDIMDIKIDIITTQYLNYIKKMEDLNLNVASEYLVMASDLIEMKSKLLLPRQQEEESFEEDPETNLINRLIEYQKYKDMTSKFKEMEELRQTIYTKLPDNLNSYVENEKVIVKDDVSLDDLMGAFEKFLKRQRENIPLETRVTNKEITVSQRRKEITRILDQKGRVNFLEFFDIITKEYVVVTFLAILEMAKAKEMLLEQDKEFGDIYCEVFIG